MKWNFGPAPVARFDRARIPIPFGLRQVLSRYPSSVLFGLRWQLIVNISYACNMFKPAAFNDNVYLLITEKWYTSYSYC